MSFQGKESYYPSAYKQLIQFYIPAYVTTKSTVFGNALFGLIHNPKACSGASCCTSTTCPINFKLSSDVYVTGPDAAVPLVNIFVAAVANAFGKTFSKPASHPYGTKKMSFEDKDFSYPEAYEQMKLLHTAAYLKLVEGGQKFKEQRERS